MTLLLLLLLPVASSAQDPGGGNAEPGNVPTADAAYPGAGDPWGFEDAWQGRSATRHRICLNGYWQFWPDANEGKEPDEEAGWCWQKVPGSWPASHRWGLFPYPFVPVLSPRWSRELPIDIQRGNWHSRNHDSGEPIPFDAVMRAWYRRRVPLPASWAGRRVVLVMEYVERRAEVYIDGRHAGVAHWPYAELDITDFVQPGSAARVGLLVQSTVSGVRGLAGDVFIEARPNGPHLDEVYLVPSVARDTLTVRAKIRRGETGARYGISGSAALGGEAVFAFPAQTAGEKGGELALTVPWAEAARWDFDHPNLHQVRIGLHDESGNLVDETLSMTMGFREFSVVGREFRLNGVPVHFRATFYKPVGASTGLADVETVDRVVRRMRDHGYNLLVSSIYTAGPGALHYPRQFLESCDRLGMAVQLQLNKATQFMTYSPEEGWALPPEAMAQWIEAVRPQILRQRGHPSLFFWASNANVLAGPEKANPHGWILDDMPRQRFDHWDIFRHVLATADDTINELDGARPVIALGNGNFRSVISSYIYPNFYPRQEQREMPSLWAAQGRKPLMIAEWGNPADISFSSHRDNKPRWPDVGTHAEPMLVEYSAVFDGDQAYALDAAGVSLYRRLDQLHAQPFSIYHWTRRHAVRLGMGQSFLKTKADHIREVLPLWRAYGVSSVGILEPYTHRQVARPGTDHWPNPHPRDGLKTPGVKPDHHVWFDAAWTHPDAERFFTLTEPGRAFRDATRPVLGMIGGHPEEAGGIAGRPANAVAGKSFRCSLVSINDTLQPQPVAARWRLVFEQQVVAEGHAEWEVDAGGRVIEPLELETPARSGAATLEVEFTHGTVITESSRVWNVITEESAHELAYIVVYDPPGATAADLHRLGAGFQTVGAEDAWPPEGQLLVIGSKALDRETPLVFVTGAADRGAGILVLAQEGETLAARLGFRYAEGHTRRLSVRRPGAPELTGLAPGLFRHWAGAGTMSDAYPDMTAAYHYSPPVTKWLGLNTTRFFHWGNTGSVAYQLIEKPVAAGFQALLDGQVDMNYAALVRVATKGSVVTLCQVDLAGRTRAEPAADRLLANLIRAGLANRPPAAVPCFTVGKLAAAWAEALGVEARPLSSVGELSPDCVAFMGPDVVEDPDRALLRPLVEKGLRALAVGWHGEALTAIAGENVVTEFDTLVYEPPLGQLPDAWAGVGPADLFWHGPVTAAVIRAIHEANPAREDDETYWTPFGSLACLKRGYGEIACLQPTPDAARHAWQSAANDKILRLMGIVLGNWGAPTRNAHLVHDLATPPDPDENRWEAGYYPRPVTLADDVFRYHAW